MDRDETRQIIQETLRELGIDPEDFRATQQDMAFVRRQRKGAEQISLWTKRASLVTAIGAFVSGIAWLVIETIKMVLRSKGGGM